MLFEVDSWLSILFWWWPRRAVRFGGIYKGRRGGWDRIMWGLEGKDRPRASWRVCLGEKWQRGLRPWYLCLPDPRFFRIYFNFFYRLSIFDFEPLGYFVFVFGIIYSSSRFYSDLEEFWGLGPSTTSGFGIGLIFVLSFLVSQYIYLLLCTKVWTQSPK